MCGKAGQKGPTSLSCSAGNYIHYRKLSGWISHQLRKTAMWGQLHIPLTSKTLTMPPWKAWPETMASLTIQLTSFQWWSVLGLPEKAHFRTKTLRLPHLMRRIYRRRAESNSSPWISRAVKHIWTKPWELLCDPEKSAALNFPTSRCLPLSTWKSRPQQSLKINTT